MTLYVFAVASLVLFLDRFTKVIAYNSLSEIQSIKVLGNIFHLTLVLNKGAAFGLLKDERLFFVSISVLAISLIIFYAYRHDRNNFFISSALGLVLGGAVGNLFDRIKFGYVVDFLDFRVWPVFNIADSCITTGTAILVFSLLFKQRKP